MVVVVVLQLLLKATFLENGPDRHEFKLFPTNILIFKLYFLSIFDIKILLNKSYGLLNLLEFKCDYFGSIFQAESQF